MNVRPDVAEYISDLAERFPCLRGLPGVRPFDPSIFAEHLREPERGDTPETLNTAGATEFVLYLAVRAMEGDEPLPAPMQELVAGFDLARVVSLMDDAHRAAVADWLLSAPTRHRLGGPGT